MAYKYCMRLLLRIPRFSSGSQMFVNLNVPTCQAVIMIRTLKRGGGSLGQKWASDGLTPCQQLRPSSRREHVNA